MKSFNELRKKWPLTGRDMGLQALLFALYLITGKCGLMLGAVSGFATFVWAPAGISFAAMALYGFRLWPAVALAAFILNLTVGAPVIAALGICAGNTLEAVLGAYLFRRAASLHPSLERVKDVLGLILLSAVAAPLIAATAGVASLWASGTIDAASLTSTWTAWWLGDLLGVLLFAPPLMTWPDAGGPSRRSSLEGLAMIGLLGAIGAILFWDPLALGIKLSRPALAFMFFPPLIWAALRFGPRGATAGLLVTTLMAVSGTAVGMGPFIAENLSKSLMLCQFFMGVTTVTTLLLAAIVSERRRAEEALRRSESDLSDFIDNAPMSLQWMNADGVILHANRAELSLLGYAAENYVGRSISDFHVDPNVSRGILRLLREGKPVQNCLARLRAKDGTFRDVLISSNVLWRDGEFVHARTYTRDITSLKAAEKALRRAHDELETRVRQRTRELRKANETLEREVTQRRKTEDILSRREAQLAQAQEVGHIGSWEWDIALNEVSISDELRRIYGFDADDKPLSYQSLLACVHPADHALREEAVQRASRSEGTFALDHRIILPNKQIRWLHTRGQVAVDSQGRPVRMFGTAQDISDRKEAEEKVAFQARLLESISDAVISTDKQFRLTSWNRAAETIYGWNEAEVLGKPVEDIVQTQFLGVDREQVLRLLGQDGYYQTAVIQRRKDGQTLYLETTSLALKDQKNNVMGYLSVNRDLTQRRKAQQALKESEERFKMMVESVKDYAIFMLDPDGNVVSWNEGATQIKGYAAADVLGKHFSIFYPPEDVALKKPDYELRVAALMGRLEEEGWRVRKDGTRFWANTVIAAMRDEFGVLRGFGKVTRDVTERKRTEETVRQLSRDLEDRVIERTQQLAETNAELQKEIAERRRAEENAKTSLREKETLLKEIHHRVKNNLQIVHSLINLQSRRVQDTVTLAGLNDCRDRVRAMALIHEKLYQSKNLEEVEFGLYIKELADILFQAYRGASRPIQLTVDADNVFLRLDEAIPCGLMVYELLSNSMKYAFPDGRAGEILISLRPTTSGFLLRVRDNGVGIPDQIDTLNPDTLGLHLVRNLTEQLDGNLELIKGDGTEFRIRFQRSDAVNNRKEAVS